MTPFPSPPSGLITGPVHRFTVRAYFEDTDLSGVVYHANYLRWFERARSDFVRLLGIDQRAAKYEQYKRNVARSQKFQVEALAQGFNASRFVYEYLTNGALLDVPVGTSGEIALVSPDSCIPDPKFEQLKESLAALKHAIASGKLPFGKNAPKEKPNKVEEPSPPASELPAENPIAFPL